MLKVINDYCLAGLCALPADSKKKRPPISWREYQSRIPTVEEIAKFPNTDGVCVLCGPVSGGLECIDFDVPEFFPRWKALITEAVNDHRYILQKTPSGGYHVIYKCEAVEPNQKLAWSETNEIAIETRGVGGLILVSPSLGYTGFETDIPVITSELRDYYLMAARALNDSKSSQTPTVPAIKEDYNDLGVGARFDSEQTIETILSMMEAEGWSRAGWSNDNYLVRRPGKAEGHSASIFLSGDKYLIRVWSTNAGIEARTYTPFQLKTYLQNGGDFSAAAKEISGPTVPAMAKPTISRPTSSWDDSFIEVPGVLGELVQFMLRNAPKRQPAFALAGAVSLVGTVTGRSWHCDQGIRPNTYNVMIAESGSGKDYPLQTIKKAERKISSDYDDWKIIGAEGWQSSQSVFDSMVAKPNCLFLVDEFGRYVSNAQSANSNLSGVLTELMKLYSSSNTTMKSSAYANKDKHNREVEFPCATILAASTPDAFGRGLAADDVSDGLYSRFSLWLGDDDPEHRMVLDVELPFAIYSVLQDYLSDHDNIKMVSMTSGGKDVFDRYRSVCNERTKTVKPGVVWSRAYEKAKKLAIIYAASDNRKSPAITGDCATWACKLATYISRNAEVFYHRYVYRSSWEKRAKQYLEHLRKAGGRMQKGELMLENFWYGDVPSQNKLLNSLELLGLIQIDGEVVILA